ncbi:MAG: hypothetical protein HKP25_05770 [Marinicaulis sp.]|nr:hypothetical protein [Marinicaulis sp.]
MRKLILSLAASFTVAPAVVAQESAADIMDAMQTRQAARMNGIDGFFLRETTGIPNTPDAFIYMEAVKDGGKTIGFRHVNPGEATKRALGPVGDYYAMGGIGMLAALGLATGELGADYGDISQGFFDMSRGAGWALHQLPEEQKEAVRQGDRDLRELGGAAAIASVISAEGHDAHLLFADGLNKTQVDDGVEYTIKSAALMIDKQRDIPLGMRVDGIAKSKKRTEPFFIQRIDRKHRFLKTLSGADTTMLIPHETEMTLGLPNLNEKDLKELAKARKDLAKARKDFEENRDQLRSLPPAQQEQFTRMMQGALEQAERQIRLLENKMTMQITKTVVDARVGSLQQYEKWLEEQLQNTSLIGAN